jgi:DNA-binding transcriptional regulator YbjK
VPDRRTEILDTALEVLAEHGMRGLTHRAVDRAAGLPAGSTSYYFRTRDSLVTGCVHRLLELDRADLPPPGADPQGRAVPGLDLLVEQATEASVRMITTNGHRTRARYELALHSIRSPSLRAEMVRAGDQLRGQIAGVLGALGVAEPAGAAEEVAAATDGMVFTALVRGPRDAARLRHWLRPQLRRVLAAYLPDDRADDRADNRADNRADDRAG